MACWRLGAGGGAGSSLHTAQWRSGMQRLQHTDLWLSQQLRELTWGCRPAAERSYIQEVMRCMHLTAQDLAGTWSYASEWWPQNLTANGEALSQQQACKAVDARCACLLAQARQRLTVHHCLGLLAGPNHMDR